MKTKKNYILFLFFFGFFAVKSLAQQEKINWISFEQLDDSLAVKPKKIFVSLYANWCSYCKKMDKVAFKNAAIISTLNKEYYAVKMNAETKESIVFEGKEFINAEVGKKRNPTHQIALLLVSRKGRPFSLPATIILDTNFKVIKRDFEYISAKKMLKMLQD